MWLKIVIIIIIVIIIWIVIAVIKSNKSKSSKKIDDCISVEDVKYHLSRETEKVLSNIEINKTTIKNAIKVANSSLSSAWLNSYEKIIRISSTLDENLNYYAKKNLEYSKFQYYTSLWYRSMLAANIVYNERKVIKKSFDALNKLIMDTKKGRNLSIPKDQIYKSKDAIKDLYRIVYERENTLNNNTAKLRDKVGCECGEKGKIWWKKRMRGRI